jgi:hypothetical protein
MPAGGDLLARGDGPQAVGAGRLRGNRVVRRHRQFNLAPAVVRANVEVKEYSESMVSNPTMVAATLVMGAGAGYLAGCCVAITRGTTHPRNDDINIRLVGQPRRAQYVPASQYYARQPAFAGYQPRPARSEPKLVVSLDAPATTSGHSWAPPVVGRPELQCRTCHHRLQSNQRFCPECGRATDQEQ